MHAVLTTGSMDASDALSFVEGPGSPYTVLTPPLKTLKKTIFNKNKRNINMNNEMEQKKEYSAPKMEIIDLKHENPLLDGSPYEGGAN